MKFRITLAIFLGSCAPLVRADSFADALSDLRAVGPEGKGNDKAAAAWKIVQEAPPDRITAILTAMDGANPLAKNYLHGALQAMSDRASSEGKKLSASALGEYVLDLQHDPEGRRAAFALLRLTEPESAELLVPGMLNDPSPDLRREAVQRLIDAAAKSAASGLKDQAGLLYRQSLSGARDEDQVKKIAEELKTLGQTVDLNRHFGFLTKWKIIGPFENTGRRGFAEVYPPEKELNFAAAYPGKSGEIKWVDFASDHELGMVDLNKPLTMLKESTAYATTEFISGMAQPAEIRLGCKNAWKIWLNGKLVFERDEYHRGMQIDQYKLPVQLEKGRNAIVVKCCQNEQTETWTVEWQFQLRVCDSSGTAILSKS